MYVYLYHIDTLRDTTARYSDAKRNRRLVGLMHLEINIWENSDIVNVTTIFLAFRAR